MTTESRRTPDASADRPGGSVVEWLFFGARLILAAVLVCTTVPEALSIDAFAVTVDSYQLLSAWPTVCLAASLPWVMCGVGLCLLVGWWTRANALLATLLVVVCAAAAASALMRDLSITCACFSLDGQTAIAWPQIALHALLLGPSGMLLWLGGGRLALDTAFRRESA